MRTTRILVLSAVIMASPALADDPADAARRIREAALADEDGIRKLESLCDDVGCRLSGSEALERAVQWAVETMKADGQENVRAEKVMVPRWVRGAESLEWIEPFAEALPILGLGGSVGTPPEGILAEVVVARDEAALEALGERAAGRIVLFDEPMPPFDPEKGAGYGRAVRFRVHGARLAAAKGAVACLVRSVTARSLRTPHAGTMSYGDADRRIPAAAITIEDAGRIRRLVERGRRVVVRLRMGARDEGLAPSANVVGELVGRERPEEIVVIGGHLDSWDVGQGAHDDGGGCVMAIQSIAILRRLGLVPRRTIRVVLWTNEENGLAGAKAYAAEHQAELARHVAAIESDSGSFDPLGFSLDCEDDGREARALERLGDTLRLLEPLGATLARAGFAGADVGPLRPHGVPTLGLLVDESRYFDYHHTPADTFDKVDPDELRRCTAAMATLAWLLAERKGRLDD